MMLETVFGIFIVLFILGLCFMIIVWSVRSLYKSTKRLRENRDLELRKEIEMLKQRVELLESEARKSSVATSRTL
jgi:cell division protein FtsB